METLNVSKKQLRRTLSFRKVKKDTVKNTLANPYSRYWPLVSPEHAAQLITTLQKHLPKIKQETIVKVPWKLIKKVPKSERKEFRQNFRSEDVELSLDKRSGLIFGINEVTKLLENDMCACVLITSDVTPQLMVRHVVDMAVLTSTPVLVMPDLRKILKSCCGLSSVSLGVKKDVLNNSGLCVIVKQVKEIYGHYPVPKDHINYHRINVEDSKDVEMVESSGNKTNVGKLDSEEEFVYLQRTNNGKRAFVPELSEFSGRMVNETVAGSSDGFLAFNQDENKSINMTKKQYKSLVIKRLKGNKDREKRKQEQLKGKKSKLLK